MSTDVRLRNYSMLVGKKQDDNWYEWCVFVDEDSETLEKIRSVEYTLHPTFPNPIRRVDDRASRFALFSSGWGGFTIGVDIEWKDGSHTKIAHLLELSADKWPKKSAPKQFESTEVEKIYRALFHEKFRWRKAETVARIVNVPEGRVGEILNYLVKADLVRKASFLSFEKKELWAPTAVVGVSPHL